MFVIVLVWVPCGHWFIQYALVNDTCLVICRCAMLLEVMERMTLSIEGKGNVCFLKRLTVHSYILLSFEVSCWFTLFN